MNNNENNLLEKLATIFTDTESEIAALKAAVSHYDEGYNIFIKVVGKDFHLSFPASFADSLCKVQENFYRSVAFSLHGKDNIRKLTQEELREYELTFTIKEGCTEFLTNIIEKLAALVERVMNGMDGKAKATFFLKLIGIVAGTFFACHTVSSYASLEETSAAEQTKQLKEQEETKRLEAALQTNRGTLPSPQQIISHFESSAADNEQAVLKGARNADSLIFNGKEFSKEDIDDANQRAAKIPKTSEIITGKYHVIIINSRDSSTIRLTLSDNSGNELSVALDTLEFDADQIEKIWNAAKTYRPIHLVINTTKAGNTIKHAYIADIPSAESK